MEGILLADKPKDWTSQDVCAFVRKRFHVKKVGHAGTLDPLATGLLILLLGKATKSSSLLSACEKEYRGSMELGVETDSHDRQGAVLRETAWEHVTLEEVREKAKDFTGDIVQVPPMVSALKYRGVRLYELARRGVVVPREGRRVTVHYFEIERQEGRFVFFSVCVSKGTYVRTLIHDLGETLGCYATLAALRRIRSGPFKIEKALTIDQMRLVQARELETALVPLDRLPFYVDCHRS